MARDAVVASVAADESEYFPDKAEDEGGEPGPLVCLVFFSHIRVHFHMHVM